ncbi:hypothetical protein [Arthrobacter sp. Y-9]|uniref:4'-phosphopantetheinyl transferase family protein n=1 Tax=Arthrobacter sp. Y-9 TaxID=3039385 RepID=UPI00241E9EAC|nr:hypothetical protein [Arthrobacter sp. Y-9]WFR83463.1 hypothetical protein P9849_12995 [Arthrobacter sp. Y-9]
MESQVAAEMVDVVAELWASLTSTEIPALARAQHGKPVLVLGDERRADLTVSIAHDSSSVGVAFSFRRSIGLDIESRERVIPPAVELLLTPISAPSPRFLTPVEAWTVYEALAKADGRGLGLGISGLSIAGTAAGGNVWAVADGSTYAVHTTTLDTGSTVSVAVQGAGPVSVRLVVPGSGMGAV